MQPENQFGSVANRRWQLRWGHILLALFFVVLAAIAYIVIHQIRTADNATQSSLNNGTHTATSQNKSSSKSGSSSNKAPVATAPKNSSPTPQPQPTPSPGPSTKSTGTTKSSADTGSSPALANTGPGDTTALFIAAAFLGGLAHHAYIKRRLGISK